MGREQWYSFRGFFSIVVAVHLDLTISASSSRYLDIHHIEEANKLQVGEYHQCAYYIEL
jgi:hypothetical protein